MAPRCGRERPDNGSLHRRAPQQNKASIRSPGLSLRERCQSSRQHVYIGDVDAQLTLGSAGVGAIAMLSLSIAVHVRSFPINGPITSAGQATTTAIRPPLR